MANLFGEVGLLLLNLYQEFLLSLPNWAQIFINLFLISLVIVLYSIFVWKFHKFVSHKNIFSINLQKYNRSDHPVIAKTIAVFFYFLEYIVILPFLIFFWFMVFTIFLILLTENLELDKILIFSTALITAVRMTAYYKEDLSKDIAKLIPFTILAGSLAVGGTFSFEKILGQIVAIPNFFNHIFTYLLFIFLVEMILRVLETAFIASGAATDDETKGD